MSDREVRIDRTPFDPQGPPSTMRQWFCPACGRNLSGKSIGLEPARAKCTAKWHLAEPVPADYVLASKEAPDAGAE